MEETRLQKDERSLSRLFPDVVWLLVFEHLLQRPEKVANMFFASAFFRNLLRSRRNEFLFSRLLSTELINFLRNATYQETATSIVSSRPSLLKFRLICRSWKKAVENTMVPIFGRAPIRQRPIIVSIKHEDDEELKFMSHFEESHSQVYPSKSPFIGTTVSFIVHWNIDGGNAGNLDIPLKQLLSMYGSHIRMCNLDFNCKAVSKQWFEAVVLHALFYMPNARALKLTLNPKDFVTSGNPVNLPDMSEIPDFETNSLSLTMDKDSDGIVSKLLSRMPNLQTLSMTYTGEIPSSQNLLPALNTSRLEDLELSFKAVDRQFQPCLEYLGNHPTLQEHPCLLDAGLHAVFRTLQANSPMNYLRSLQISVTCTHPSSWHEWKKYTINLPNLAEFTLSTWTWPCIDMVLLFRDSLEKLTLNVQSAQTFEEWQTLEGAKGQMDEEQIKFLSCNSSFDKDSNIWKEVPKLEEVTLSAGIPGHMLPKRLQSYYPNGEASGFNIGKIFKLRYLL